MDGRGVFAAQRIYLSQWNYNSGLYHWLEGALSGVSTPSTLLLTPETEGAIRLAKILSAGLFGLLWLVCAASAWRRDVTQDVPQGGHVEDLTPRLLRLAFFIWSAFLLLTTTLHPWYATMILPWLPFLLPKERESGAFGRFIWPRLYFAWAVALSYLT